MHYKIEPWQHQHEAIRKSLDPSAQNFALLWEPGTGKTATTINILRHRFNRKKTVSRTIIFCPPVVVKNWYDEWLAHSNIDPAKVIMLKGKGDVRVKTFIKNAYQNYLSPTKDPVGCIFITNYESLMMPSLFMAMKSWEPEVLVFDESHKLKNISAQRSKRADVLANPTRDTTHRNYGTIVRPYKMILTGTPVLKNGMDLFMQYKILDGGELLGDNFYTFRARYCEDKNAHMPKDKYFPKWEMREWALDAIAGLARKITSIAKKNECLDLPPYVTKTLSVGMTSAQAEAYRQLESELVTYLDAMAVTAPMALTKAGKLLQITSGFVKGDVGDNHVFGETPKDVALGELLEEITPSHKVIVWAVFKENYARIRHICNRMKLPFVELHGDVPEKDRDENIRRFNKDEDCRVLIGHPGSGGIGVNLVSASYSIFYSRTFSLEHSLQAEARNYRGGSNIHEKVTRIDLVCENTIEQDVQKALAEKLEIGEKVLREIARGRSKQNV